MTRITVAARLLAADSVKRELTYRILPFGEPGFTNQGKITATAGTITLPRDPAELTFNIEHDSLQPVGRGVALTEAKDGIDATFRVSRTTRGDDLLVEAADGLRAGASVEIEDSVIRAGRLIAGRLTAVAAVVNPAFASAQLKLVAADCGELPTNQEETMPPTNPADGSLQASAADDLAEAVVEVVAEADQPDDAPEDATDVPAQAAAVTAARAPLGVQRPGATQVKARQHSILTASQMLADIASRTKGRGMSTQLLAALSEITSGDALDIATPESFEGKIWQGRKYERRFIDLISTAGLTSLEYWGWKWKDGKKPVIRSYAGFPAEPPTNDVEAEKVTWEPDLYAWAGRFDRKYRDFSNPEFWSNFFEEGSTSYAKSTDTDVLTALTTAATAVEVDLDDKPAGVPEGLFKLIKGIRSVLPYGMPTGAVLEFDLWEEVIFTPQDQVLPYLKIAMGIENGQALDFTMKPAEELGTGEVLVAVKQAAVFRELPGAGPIRVDAEVISKGGLEQGFFGYAGVEVFEEGGLALVSTEV